MAIVKVNENTFEIDKIISFGCSFTAGEELLSHHIHPDADNIKRNKGISYWKENFETAETLKLSSQEQKISWAGQVATTLNVEFEGKARGGASLPYSLYHLEEMIYEEKITDKTLILFGVTTMGRSLYFYNNSGIIKSFLYGHPQWWPKKDWDQQTVLDIFNDPMQLWLQLNYLHRLVQISNKLNGRLLIFSMNGFVPALPVENESKKYPLFRYKYNEILSAPFVYSDKSLLGLCKNQLKDQHGGNHPKLHIHKKFADYVIGKLK